MLLVMKPLTAAFVACLLAVGLFADPRNSQQAAKATPADRAAAAQQAGVASADFEKAAKAHKHLHLDKGKRALFACEGLAAQVGPDTSGYTSTALYPLADTFSLHSRSGARKVIYLDFTGHTTANTPWNSGVNAGINIVSPVFDLDGDPTTFSAAERAAIQDVWRRVSEDYAAFDVDVTTADPGLEAIRRTSTADANYGVRCVIGGSSMQWLGSGAGGVAYVGTFNAVVSASLTANDIPAFVFPAQLGNSARLIAEAASHEVGHTLGLYHSGQTTGVEYYAGHADWAPIMGVSYYKAVTQWTKGDYPLSNNTQDQVAIISSKLPRVAPSHGGNAAAASVVTGDGFTAGGIVASGVQQDWFKLTSGAGALSISGAVGQPSPDLKLALSLVDSSGAVVARGVANGLGANLNATVAGGDYYLVVEGTGSTNDPTTGYTDYGSLGRYGLAGSWPAATVTPPPPPPVVPNIPPVASSAGSTPLTGVAPLSVKLVGTASTDADGSIVAYRWEFGDGSAAVTTSSATHVYAAGTYTARLSVTDDDGATSSTTVQVVVTNPTTPPPPPPPPVVKASCHVASIKMSWIKVSNAVGYAQGVVTIVDNAGKPVSGALVTVKSTGLVVGSGQGRTDSRGQLVLVTTRLSSALKGDMSFAVTAVSHPKLPYDPTQNVVTKATLTLAGATVVVQPPSYRPHGAGDDDDDGRRR
jgi:hypothetical protein